MVIHFEFELQDVAGGPERARLLSRPVRAAEHVGKETRLSGRKEHGHVPKEQEAQVL